MEVHYEEGWRRTGDGYTGEDYEKLGSARAARGRTQSARRRRWPGS